MPEDHLKLYMILLGCKPQGRHTEQHDVFFGIASSLKELVPALHAFWPEAKKNLHVDAWREVSAVQNYSVSIQPKTNEHQKLKLFFLNLGGYRKGEFEEQHYNMLLVAEDLAAAIAMAKQELFYKENGFKGASAHIDDKYGIDVDEAYAVEDILPDAFSHAYSLLISKQEKEKDAIHLGYLPLWKIK